MVFTSGVAGAAVELVAAETLTLAILLRMSSESVSMRRSRSLLNLRLHPLALTVGNDRYAEPESSRPPSVIILVSTPLRRAHQASEDDAGKERDAVPEGEEVDATR